MVSARDVLVCLLACALLTGCGTSTEPTPDPIVDEPQPGLLTTAVGTGRQGFDGDGNAPRESWLNQPTEVAFDADDNLYVIDWNNHRIRERVAGVLRTRVGTELPGDWPPDAAADAELRAAELSLNHPLDVAFDAEGRAIVAAWHNHKLLELDAAHESVRRLAGGNRPGYAGDDGESLHALLNFPASVVIDASGALLVSDQRNNVIRRLSSAAISTVIGVKGLSSYAGDDGPAASAGLGLCPYDEAGGSDNPPPGGAIALDAEGNLYIADTYNHCVRKVSAGRDGLVGAGDAEEELIETIAGVCGEAGFDAEPSAASLRLDTPRDVEVQHGNLYIADTGNHVVWRMDLETHEVERFVGTGSAGNVTEGVPAREATLREPYGIGFDRAENLYIADTLNQRIRVRGKERE
jgi:hypothetical protein